MASPQPPQETEKPTGRSLVTAIIEGTEDQKRLALGTIARHAWNLGKATNAPAADDLLMDVLKAQRTLLGSSREKLHKQFREIASHLGGAVGRLIPVSRGPDLHLMLDLARVLGLPELIPQLKPILGSSDRWAAVMALQAIAAAGGNDAVQTLVEALQVEPLRWSAVALLADLKAASTLQAVVRMFGDQSPEVRIETVRAVESFGDPRVVPLLQKVCVKDPEERVRDVALGAMRALSTRHGLRIDEAALKEALQAQMRSDKVLDRLLRDARLAGASDVHVVPGSPPAFRIHGDLAAVGHEPLDRETSAAMIREIVPDRAAKEIAENLQADFPYVLPGVGRHRVNVFTERRGLSAVIRLIPKEPPAIASLGLPPQVKDIVSLQQGMIVVTGRSGSGKTTTMAALVNLLNETRPLHIITLEDPVEYVHERKRGLVNQREIGRHSASFPAALRSALREDPDVIVVGEMRDLVTMRLAVEAAETGHLVIATLHTPTAIGAIQRLIESVPVAEQQQIRLMVSESVRMVIAQALIRRVDGKGRVGCFELLVCTQAVSNLVRESKLSQVVGLMQTGRDIGQKTFDAALLELVQAGEIDAEDAFVRAQNKEPFRAFLKQAEGAGEMQAQERRR